MMPKGAGLTSITNNTGLVFRGFFAAGDEDPASYDQDDHIVVQSQIDGGTINELLPFESDSGSVDSRPLAQDTTGDGIGNGTVLGLNFTEFTAPIPGTGNSLVITILIEMDSGFESVGIDNIEITAVTVPVELMHFTIE